MNKLHIMLDFETLGKKVRAPIIQIGAVAALETDESVDILDGSAFKENIDWDCAISNRKPDGSTLQWWMKQSEEARNSVMQDGVHVTTALDHFTVYVSELKRLHNIDEVYVWGNGASSDNAWINDLYEQNGRQAPWEYWGNMCYRTLKNYNRDVPRVPFLGVKHDALADAKSQMAHLVPILKKLKGLPYA